MSIFFTHWNEDEPRPFDHWLENSDDMVDFNKAEETLKRIAFRKLCERHDWHYDYADDHRVYSKGASERQTLIATAMERGPEYQKIFNTLFAQNCKGATYNFPNASSEDGGKTEKQQEKPQHPDTMNNWQNITLGQLVAALVTLILGGNTAAATPTIETTVEAPAKPAKPAKPAAAAKAPATAPAGDDDDDLLASLGTAPAPAPAAADITLDDIRKAAVAAIKSKEDGPERDAIKAKIQKVIEAAGAPDITSVPPAKFKAVMKALKTLAAAE
jgi:hypothetical protein